MQTLLERDVAVKIILARYANQLNLIRCFKAEAELIARLERPHIVPLYDYWREPDAAYLIMRLLRGGSLEDQLQSGQIPLELASNYIFHIGLALDLAHRNGIVHRCIKPANVLLDEEGNAYVGDFGIAKYLKGIDSQSLTEDSVLIGSPATSHFQSQLRWPSFSSILARLYPLFKRVIPNYHLNWMLLSTRPPPRIPPIDIKTYLL